MHLQLIGRQRVRLTINRKETFRRLWLDAIRKRFEVMLLETTRQFQVVWVWGKRD